MSVPREDVARALEAGYAAKDRGADWLTAFDACLTGLGYGYTGAPCECGDPTEGHEPHCGWARVAPPSIAEQMVANLNAIPEKVKPATEEDDIEQARRSR